MRDLVEDLPGEGFKGVLGGSEGSTSGLGVPLTCGVSRSLPVAVLNHGCETERRRDCSQRERLRRWPGWVGREAVQGL